jgi:uncharacterized membrane protein
MSSPHTLALVALFEGSLGAGDALADLYESGIVSETMIQNSAVLRADAAGRLHVFVTTDRSGRKRAAIGGVAGGIVGLFGSTVVSPGPLAAMTSGLATELRDAGFPGSRLNDLRTRIQPACSILVITVTDGNNVVAMLRRAGATVVCEPIDDHLRKALENEAANLTARHHSGLESLATRPSESAIGRPKAPLSRAPLPLRGRTGDVAIYDQGGALQFAGRAR